MAEDGLQVAALVADRAPALGREDPASLLATDGLCELDERGCVGRLGSADANHVTTTPAPPRRGSPAAASAPSVSTLDRLHAAEVEVATRPADDLPALLERPRSSPRTGRPRHATSSPSTCRRGASIASVDGRATDRRPARRPGRSRRRGAPSPRCRGRAVRGRPAGRASASAWSAAASPLARGSCPITSSSPSMLFICAPPRKTPEPDPSVDESAAAVPERVDDGDVRRTGEPAAAGRADRRPGAPAPCLRGTARRSRRDARGSRRRSRRRATAAVRRRPGGRAGSSRAARGRRPRSQRGRPRTPGEARRPRRPRTSRMRSSVAQSSPVSTRVGVAVDATATLVAEQDRGEDSVQERARLVTRDAVLRQLERRLDEIRPVEGREAAVSLVEPGDEPRHRDRSLPDVEDLGSCVREIDQHLVHDSRPRRRNREEAVEQRCLSIRLVHEEEPAAGRPRQRPFRHEGGEGCREQRVDRIAARPKHLRACLGGQRVAGCDRAAHRRKVPRDRARCRTRVRQPEFRNAGSSSSEFRVWSRCRTSGASVRRRELRRGRWRRRSPRPDR